MPSLLQTFLLLALVTFVLAAPAPHAPIQKRRFKVERIANPNYVRKAGAGTRALVKAYRKYSVPLPEGLLDAMNAAKGGQGGAAADDADGLNALTNALNGLLGDGAATGTGAGANTQTGKKNGKGSAKPTGAAAAAGAKSTGSAGTGATTGAAATNGSTGAGKVTATPESGDVEYLSPVTIGGQTINMDFDSGSSDLWVFNTQLAAQSQTGHQVFDSKRSTSFKTMEGASFTISYGDGSGAAGNVGTDTVNIGGATVTNQAIELATAVSASFVQDTANNGLVGLAFSKLNTVKPQQQKTFFDNAMATLPEPVFTADLRHNAVGAYEFGNIDATKFNGSLTWSPINNTQGFWQFSSQKFAVGTGAPMQVTGGQAIADTGTTLMLVNPAVVNAYYSQVTGAVNNQTVGGVTFPCNAVLPDLQVDIGGTNMATVRGTDINFAPVDATGQSKCLLQSQKPCASILTNVIACFGGVQAIQGNLQIYGDIMFKSQFVAFNGGNNSIGMAPHQ
jgi:hypothetical protein